MCGLLEESTTCMHPTRRAGHELNQKHASPWVNVTLPGHKRTYGSKYGWTDGHPYMPNQSIFAFRRRSALPITETELKLIAAAAIIGLSRSPKNG